MFADHKDTPSCNDAKVDGPCIHKQGYNCQQSDVAVPTAYLNTELQNEILHPDVCGTVDFLFISSLAKSDVSHSHERAPPGHV